MYDNVNISATFLKWGKKSVGGDVFKIYWHMTPYL